MLIFLSFSNTSAQSYIGLNLGIGIDNIKEKENSVNFKVLDKGYKIKYMSYGLRYEKKIFKNLAISINNDFSVSKFSTNSNGINPIVEMKMRNNRSSLIVKYILYDKIFFGVGLNSLFVSGKKKHHYINDNRGYSSLELIHLNPIYTIGINIQRVLIEFYHINGNIYHNSSEDSIIQPIKSIGCSASYLFRLPQRNNKKGVECPTF